MKPIEINENCCQQRERISRRFAGDVEIIERESVRTIRKNVYEPLARRAPRLVIGDALTATKSFITKTRAEITELDTFLRSLKGEVAEARTQ